MKTNNRRDFLKATTSGLIAGILPASLVRFASADENGPDYTFAYISDAHIQHIEGSKFVRNWDQGLIRAVAETNLLEPKPDFVVFGGDLAQLGTKAELDHGAQCRDPETTLDAEPECHRHRARRDDQHRGEGQLQRSELDKVAHAGPLR